MALRWSAWPCLQFLDKDWVDDMGHAVRIHRCFILTAIWWGYGVWIVWRALSWRVCAFALALAPTWTSFDAIADGPAAPVSAGLQWHPAPQWN